MRIRMAGRENGAVYLLGMKNTEETVERLLRVRATRRGQPVELCVHYERAVESGCITFKLFSVEDNNFGTSTN